MRGVVVLGDSASAHFHVPPNWLTAQNIDGDTFKNILEIVENEADWPMYSATTAFDVNDTRFVHDITGKVNSTYLTLRDLNRCMHRDFQVHSHHHSLCFLIAMLPYRFSLKKSQISY